jgi:hypothetical protein
MYEGFQIEDIIQENNHTFTIRIRLDKWESIYITKEKPRNITYEIKATCTSIEKLRELKRIKFNSAEGYAFIRRNVGWGRNYNSSKLEIDLVEAVQRFALPHKRIFSPPNFSEAASAKIGNLYYYFSFKRLLQFDGNLPEKNELPCSPLNVLSRFRDKDFQRITELIAPKCDKIWDAEMMFFQSEWENMVREGFADPIGFLDDTTVSLALVTREDIISDYLDNVVNCQVAHDYELVINTNSKNIAIFEKKYTLEYFLFGLGAKNKSAIDRVSSEWEFVKSKTKGLENSDFGRKGEHALNNYLIKNFQGHNWASGADSEAKGRFVESDCSIVWCNKTKESYSPYDFIVKGFHQDIKIEVKSTRLNEDAVFYFSIAELQEVLEHTSRYVIAILSFLSKEKSYDGIKINDEFCAQFYVFNKETVSLISEKIDEWRDYYGENTIRFAIVHFERIESSIAFPEQPECAAVPHYSDTKYWNGFPEYVENRFFSGARKILNEFKPILPGPLTKTYQDKIEQFTHSPIFSTKVLSSELLLR